MKSTGSVPSATVDGAKAAVRSSQFYAWFIALMVVTLVATSCTISQNPLSGRDRVMGFTWEQEERLGREADESIQRQFGTYEDEGLNNYIDGLGQEIVDVSHIRRPETAEQIRNTEFFFRVLDSEVPNAMALPGGYIYVTRGLLAHLNNEAQLMLVLGHEVGHVAGRHASRRAAEQQLTQLGVIGAALGGEALGLPGGAIFEAGAAGAQLLFLRYSRDDEREADRVGVEYTALTGYQAAEGAEFFRSLQRIGEQRNQQIPNFLSTHPNPGERAQTIVQLAQEWEQEADMTRIGEQEFFGQIEGLVLGENPRDGFEEDNTYYHPNLAFQFPVPRGFELINQPTAVVLVEENNRAQMALQIIHDANSTREALSRVLDQDGVRVIEQGSTQSHNIPARYAVVEGQTQRGRVRALVYVLEYDGEIYGFQGIAPVDRYSEFERRFTDTAQGFRALTDQQILNVQPTRIRVQSVNQPAPFRQFVNEGALPPGMSIQDLAIINQVEVDERVEAGRRLKLPTN